MPVQGSSLPTLGSQSHSLKLTPYHFSVFPMALLVRHPRFLFYTRSSLTLLLLFNIVKLSFLSNTWKKSVRSCGCLSNRGILFNTCVMNQNWDTKYALLWSVFMESQCHSNAIFVNPLASRKFKVRRGNLDPINGVPPPQRDLRLILFQRNVDMFYRNNQLC